MMTPERWQQVESLVEAALEVDGDDRPGFLDAACGDDAALRREVETLLASLDQVDSFMERPAFQGLGLAADAARAPTPAASDRRSGELAEGDRIGHYRILHEIGRGGMGTVYVAERDDQEYQHRVAIKLIQPGMHSAAVAQRFRSERQILANLDHPNIARLLDGGTAGDGRPFVVMELVEGIRIDEYCDRDRLSVRQRLELFREVCAAVDYAHRNLVVHRDIKPSNILVTDRGVPKLLDFGIAKLLDPTDFPHTVEVTRSELRPMTPPYASPEQVLGRAITTASDVYSLGVLLYKLLTGRLPHAIAEASPQEMQRALLEDRVARPSLAITRAGAAGELASEAGAEAVSRKRNTQPQQLRRLLAGDVDNIVLMALRQEPQRRYGSVDQLSEDLRRHLEGLPVSARRDTLGYRAGKFLRRNQVAAGVAGASVAVVLGFAATMARQRDRARRERDKAERVAAFLTGLFDLADPDEASGSNITAREILESGVEKIYRELADQPDLQATLMGTIGRTYRRLGLFDQATPLLEEALAIRERLLGEDHVDVAETLDELAMLYNLMGLYDQAGALFQRALDIRHTALGPSHASTAEAMIHLAGNYFTSDDEASASTLIEAGLKILERISDPPQLLLAQSLELRGHIHVRRGEYDRAEESQERAIALLERALEPNQVAIAIGVINLGNIYTIFCDYGRAESAYKRALRVLQRAVGREHLDIAVCLSSIGICHSVKGDYGRAESLLLSGLKIAEKTLGTNHRIIADTRSKLAILYRRKGDFDRAERFFTRASESYRNSVSESNVSDAYNACHQAQLYRDWARFDHAEPLYQRAMKIQRRVLGSSHLDLAESLSGLAGLYARQHKYQAAKAHYDESLVVAQRVTSRHPRNLRSQAQLAVVHLGLGDIQHSLGQEERARQAWSRALTTITAVTASTDVVDFLDTESRALLRLNRIDEARPIVDRLLAIGWCTPDFLDLCRQHGLATISDHGEDRPSDREER